MPFFSKSKKDSNRKSPSPKNVPEPQEPAPVPAGADGEAPMEPPKMVFNCQQAHGSPTALISGFTNVKELYGKIAVSFNIDPKEIIFCTLNTHKVDMNHLLGGQIGLEDFIFAHIKGQPKVVDVLKKDEALGLTITDNGAGLAFIKRIKEGSIMDGIDGVCIGDQIAKINDWSTEGSRHYEVAKRLKEIPRGETFKLRVIEPVKAGFYNIGPQSANKGSSKGIGCGKKTIRLRSNGPATIEDKDDISDVAIEKINNLLESFLGINDADLAQSIWDIGTKLDNPSTFATALEESDMAEFGFTDDFIFDLWGSINDAKNGRLVAPPPASRTLANFGEQF